MGNLLICVSVKKIQEPSTAYQKIEIKFYGIGLGEDVTAAN